MAAISDQLPYPHRQLPPSGDRRGVNSSTLVPNDLVSRHEVKQIVKRDNGFHSAERGAETTVDAIAECEVLRSAMVSVDVEDIGVTEDFRVAVSRHLALFFLIIR
jgi:hypothetical protein